MTSDAAQFNQAPISIPSIEDLQTWPQVLHDIQVTNKLQDIHTEIETLQAKASQLQGQLGKPPLQIPDAKRTRHSIKKS